MLSIVNMGTPHNVEHAWKHQTVVVCVSNSYLSTNHLASHYDTVCQNLGFDHPHLSVYLVHCFMVGTLRVCCFRVRVICEPIHQQKKKKGKRAAGTMCNHICFWTLPGYRMCLVQVSGLVT